MYNNTKDSTVTKAIYKKKSNTRDIKFPGFENIAKLYYSKGHVTGIESNILKMEWKKDHINFHVDSQWKFQEYEIEKMIISSYMV